jgi:hypothetical protein
MFGLLLIAAPICIICILSDLFHLEPRSESDRAIALILMDLELVGETPKQEPEYSKLVSSIIENSTIVSSYTESLPIHGDGIDVYEVRFEANFLDKLNKAISLKDSRFRKCPPLNAATTVFGIDPLWWPNEWNEKALCYSRDLNYLVLKDGESSSSFLLRSRT